MDLLSKHGIGTGSQAVEDIIQSYAISSDGNINIGDLCEFINGQARKTWSVTGSSVFSQITGGTISYISATMIDSTRTIVSYQNNYNGYMYSVVLTISGATITKGNIIQVNSTASGWIKSVLLDSTHVVVIYDNLSNNYLYSMVLTISGTTITAGTELQVNSVYSTDLSVIKLDSTHALVCYSNYNNSSYLYAVVLTISGTTITVGTITQVTSVASIYTSIAYLDSTRVIVCYKNSYLYAVVLTISGTTITVGSAIQANNYTSNWISTIAIDSSHVVVSYGITANLCSLVLVVSGTTITKGTPIQVTSTDASYISSALLDSTHTILSYMDNSTNYLCVVVLTISGNTITAGSALQTNTMIYGFISSVLLDSIHLLVSYRNNSDAGLYSVVIGIDINKNASLTVITHAKQPNLVALSSGTVGSTIRFAIKGIAKGLTGLTPSGTYYCDSNGNLTTTVTEAKVGVALSATELLVKKAFWER